MNDGIEYERQRYLLDLAKIVEEEKLAPAQATQLMFSEIASWLMVIAKLLDHREEVRDGN
jgi:hypothetical protein